MSSLSIVIPVYNSEKTIEAVCSALIYLYSGKHRLQLILVNDGSRDSSDLRCRRLQAAYPAVVTYLKLARNFGEHNAVMAGLNQATGDYCVVMDDDLQNPPEEVARLLGEIQKGYDVVYGRYRRKRDSVFRNMGSAFNDRVATLLLRKPVDLYLSSFKIMNRFLYREVVQYKGPAPYVDAIILRTTDNIGSLWLEHRQRPASRSGYTLKKLVTLWGNMVVSYSLVPLRIIGMIGLLLISVGTVYGFFKAYDDLSSYGTLSDFETLMSANLIFRGLIMIAVSVLGEYVGRIYLLLNNDPQFVVRERLGGAAAVRKVTALQGYRENDEYR